MAYLFQKWPTLIAILFFRKCIIYQSHCTTKGYLDVCFKFRHLFGIVVWYGSKIMHIPAVSIYYIWWRYRQRVGTCTLARGALAAAAPRQAAPFVVGSANRGAGSWWSTVLCIWNCQPIFCENLFVPVYPSTADPGRAISLSKAHLRSSIRQKLSAYWVFSLVKLKGGSWGLLVLASPNIQSTRYPSRSQAEAAARSHQICQHRSQNAVGSFICKAL